MVGARIFCFVVLLTLFAHVATAAVVRVRLDSRQSPFKISGMMLRFPGQPVPEMGFQSVEVQWVRGAGRFFDWTVRARDNGRIVARFRAPSFEVSGTMIRSGLQSVPDRLSLLPRRNGKSDLVATMDVEEYLKGVLPMEMPVAWPIEALKAQAIAARTFTLNRIAERDRVGGSYHVEANVMDQVFKFDTGLSSAEKFKIETAVSETRGMVLKDKKDRAIAAYFHADCGGQTEDARSVWGSGPSMGLAVDASCPVHSVWQARLSRKSIAKHLSQNDPTMGSKKLASLVTLSKTGTGRVDAMKAVWSDGSESSMSGHAFRMAMGHELIKSTKFEFRSDAASGEIVFNGSGHGHGVGLCQWGARQMASQGKKFEQILAHYYPNATLTGLRSP